MVLILPLVLYVRSFTLDRRDCLPGSRSPTRIMNEIRIRSIKAIDGLQPISRDTDNNDVIYNCWWMNKRSYGEMYMAASQ